MSNVSDKIHVVDAKITAATVACSKEVVVSANRELERHELWLERHHEVYSETLKECQRQLRRQNLISACKQTALLPIRLLASGCTALFRGVRAHPRRSRRRADLQNRIDRMEQRRRFIQLTGLAAILLGKDVRPRRPLSRLNIRIAKPG